jgi:hypothetical protein
MTDTTENQKLKIPSQWLIIIAITGLLLVTLWPAIFGDLETLIWACGFDDGYYYLQIARNTTGGHGLSFDRLHRTNGFHPLWQAILLPLYALIREPETALRAAVILQTILLGAATFLLAKTLRTHFPPFAVYTGILILAYRRLNTLFTSYMESAVLYLAMTFVLIMFYQVQQKWQKGETPSKRTFWLLGTAIGLLVTARIDYSFFAVTLLIILALQAALRKKKWFAIAPHILPLGLPALLLLGPFLIWNQLTFSHVSTISAAIKSGFRLENLRLQGLLRWGLDYFLVILLIFVMFLAFILLQTKFKQKPFWIQLPHPLTEATAALSTGVLVHFLVTLLLSKFGLGVWYFAGYLPIFQLWVVILLTLLFTTFRGKQRFLLQWLMVLILPFVIAATHLYAIRQKAQGDVGFLNKAYQAGQWVRTNLPEDAILGMADAGIFSYASDRSVINLDGVVNNFHYQERLLRYEFREYLLDNNVGYLVSNAVPVDQYEERGYFRFCSYSFQYDVSGGCLNLTRDREIYRSASFDYRGAQRYLIIWQFDAEVQTVPRLKHQQKANDNNP